MGPESCEKQSRKDKAILSLWYLALLILIIITHLSMADFINDDAFIHFRIARNLVESGEPFFNLGEKVLASSSPVFTFFVIAPIFVLFGKSLSAVLVVCAIISWIAVFLLARLVAASQEKLSLSKEFTISTSFLLALLPASISCMETSLAVAVMALGGVLFYRHNAMAFMLIALGIFVRLELILLLVLFLIFVIFSRDTKFFCRAICWIFAGVVIPVLMLLYWFGGVIPQTIFAKKLLYDVHHITNIMFIMFHYTGVFPPQWILAPITCFVTFLVILILIQNYKRHVVPVVFGLFGMLLLVLYSLSGVIIFRWYAPIYTVPLFVCLFASKTVLRVIPLSAILLFPLIDNLRLFGFDPFNRPAHQALLDGARVRKYLEVGEALYNRYPKATLASVEIGGLGFSFKGKILDGAGLASPEALRFHPMKIPEERGSGAFGAMPFGLISARLPEIVIGYGKFLKEFISSELSARYCRYSTSVFLKEDEERLASNSIWGSRELFIFVLREIDKKCSFPVETVR